MNIYVDGKPAVLKKGFSFDYVAENRLFLGRDGYTLNISFPLRDCAQNVEIFGYIHRSEASMRKTTFDCIIQDHEVSLRGLLCVTKVSDVEVECQFAEGRCAQVAADPFENVRVNELDLGDPGLHTPRSTPPSIAWMGSKAGHEAVALPWVNENYPDVPNNWVRKTSTGYAWDGEVAGLSWQPYLVIIAERICREIGYTCDFSAWRQSPMRHLIVCNTLPASWELTGYADALPAWTVSEFFEKLELFMMCEFDFDHARKHVRMQFTKSILPDIAPVQLENIVDSYEGAVSQGENPNCDYLGAKRLAYKECSHEMWPYYSCDWYIRKLYRLVKYPTLEALLQAAKLHKKELTSSGGAIWEWGESGNLLYAADVDTYFVHLSIGSGYYGPIEIGEDHGPLYIPQPVNLFGSGSVESDDVPTEEIEFVPVCVMDTFMSDTDNKGPMMFLNPGSFRDDGADDPEGSTRQPLAAADIKAGAQDRRSAFYDVVYLAYWDGEMQSDLPAIPIIDSVNTTQSWEYFIKPGFSMRLTGSNSPISQLPAVDPRRKYKFSWLGSSIPNPRAVFFINGHRYLCEKITATFTENGMSQLLKGEFYPLAD